MNTRIESIVALLGCIIFIGLCVTSVVNIFAPSLLDSWLNLFFLLSTIVWAISPIGSKIFIDQKKKGDTHE